MRKLSRRTKQTLLASDRTKVCARHATGRCAGRITFHHAIIYAGRQLDEPWSIVALCEYHHAVGRYQDGGDFNAELSEYLALCQATEQELAAVSKVINYQRRKAVLAAHYGQQR